MNFFSFCFDLYCKIVLFSISDQIPILMPSLKFEKDTDDSPKSSSNQLHNSPTMEQDDEKRSIHSTAKVEIVEDHNNDDDRLSNEQEEQRFEEEIEDLDAVEQIQVEMAVPPGAAEMTQTTSGGRGKLSILSKLP